MTDWTGSLDNLHFEPQQEHCLSVSETLEDAKQSYEKGHNHSKPERIEINGHSIRSISPENFQGTFMYAKKHFAEIFDTAWRVSNIDDIIEFIEEHLDVQCYTTEKASTIAVTKDGDIISVCKNVNDTIKGKQLIELAVKAGGIKLDSYDGNHGFYVKCGFEPVSWCKWNPDYAPPDWNPVRNKPEDVIFYMYTGRKDINADLSFFKNNIAASKDYDSAKIIRDDKIKENKK